MNGGKRGARRYSEVFLDDFKPSAPRKVETDAHPDSLIVKVKLRNGGIVVTQWSVCVSLFISEPYGNTRRLGVSMEDFLVCQAAVAAAPGAS
jgi:hypothetical protein